MSYKQVPTWDGSWTTTEFETKEEFILFLKPLFKEPGQYKFDQTSQLFNEQAQLFDQNKLYCLAPEGTKDFLKYWDNQKDKCRNGVIFKSGSETWYLPRDYYMWINFLKIYDKKEKMFRFPNIWDSQYHIFLYELLAELHSKHVAKLKKRQIGSSYIHMAKLINQLWFEEGVVMKIGASHKNYVNEQGTWKFLNEYKSFLNENTAWYRPMTPDKTLMWQQQVEVTKGNRKSMKGLKGVIQGLTFEKDPTAGVGGGILYFFYEEAGIAPTMDVTVEYLFPAMRSGQIYTGMFIAAGSVGDLDQCEPLKEMILDPITHDIYPVKSNLLDDKGTEALTGLFIPEQWSMPPFIDKYGNSLVSEALESIKEERIKDKRSLSPKKYQLRISQHPTNIREAFDFREQSVYPLHLVQAQLRRIEEKEYPYELIDLTRDAQGILEAKQSKRIPISEFPIKPGMEDKEGCLVVWERPVDTSWGTYYASIDPVGEGKTTTSDSLCSIYVAKTPNQVTMVSSGESKTYIERDKIVAAWCGRYDDAEKTHKQLESIIEWYNAWTIYENNVTGFIQYMQNLHKQRFLAHKSDMIFLKETQSNQNVYQEYGWKNMGKVFKDNIQNYGIEYLSEELATVTKEDGTIVHTTYGVERIPDPMLLKEMMAYQPGLNVDRIIAYSALIAFMKVQQSHLGLRKQIEYDKSLDKSAKKSIFIKSPFVHMGSSNSGSMTRPVRSPFKNIK